MTPFAILFPHHKAIEQPLFGAALLLLLIHASASRAAAQQAGAMDLDFKPNLAESLNPSWIEALAVQSDGKILVGGNLWNKLGPLSQGILRLNSDGTLDESFRPNLSRTQVQTLIVQHDGKILVGGYFTPAGKDDPKAIVRLNADGTVDNTFAVGAGADYVVMSILEQPDGKILVGGLFKTLAGVESAGVGRLEADGTFDSDFKPLRWSIGLVSGMTLQQDGKILLSNRSGLANLHERSGPSRSLEPGWIS